MRLFREAAYGLFMQKLIFFILIMVFLPGYAPYKQKTISVIGDSISHGAFSKEAMNNSWVRIFERSVNRFTGNKSYGFTPLLSIGEGEKYTSDVATVIFSYDKWSENIDSSISSSASPSGYSLTSTEKDAGISVTIPGFQPVLEVNWIQSPVGGRLRVYVENRVLGEIDTAGPVAWKRKTFTMGAPGKSTYSIYLQALDDRPVQIAGLGYLSRRAGVTLNNYSQSGRMLASMSEQAVSAIMAESSVLVMALGHNDQVLADGDDRYFERFQARINWLIEYANRDGVRVIVPDFCWAAPPGSRTRGELRRLAEATGGVYIDLPSRLSDNGAPVTADRLINELGMWWDPSHPNVAGHKWIAEQVEEGSRKVLGDLFGRQDAREGRDNPGTTDVPYSPSCR